MIRIHRSTQPMIPHRLILKRWLSALTLTLSLLFLACASTSDRPKPKTEAEALYYEGIDDMDDALYPEAIESFNKVKNNFPYTQWALEAEMKIAETHLKRGKYLEAVDAFRSFIRLHPNHEKTALARIQIADAYYDQIPGDWMILPPSAEKDQAQTRLAIAAYRDVIQMNPKSDSAKKANQQIDECRKKLADHELYVAKYYLKRDKFKAALGRAQGLIKNYSGLGLDDTILDIAIRSAKGLGDDSLVAKLKGTKEKNTSRNTTSENTGNKP